MNRLTHGFCQAINTKRFDRLLKLTKNDISLAHGLDRLIYRCQNSTNIHWNHKRWCFTEPLDTLYPFIGTTSKRTLQDALHKLEHLGWIGRRAIPDKAGKKAISG